MLGLGFSATNDVSGVEYLITYTSSDTSNLNGAILDYTSTAPPTSIDFLVRVHFTAADSTKYIDGILSGNFTLDIDTPSVATIGSVSLANPGNIWSGYTGTGPGDPSIPATDLQPPSGSGSPAYLATFNSLDQEWIPTGDYYLTLGQFTLSNIDVNVPNPISAVINVRATADWNSVSGNPLSFSPAPSGFTVTVPEPSTYISAAMACAALSGVALKKRKAKKAVATA